MIRAVETGLGFRLPGSYIELMHTRNGGLVQYGGFRLAQQIAGGSDGVSISGIHSLDGSKMYSLLGGLGSRFMIGEWGYPPIGVYICDCPSAGHDLVGLDYRACGKDGEPQVVHVDQEDNYRITFLADSFERFVRGLEPEEAFM